MGATRGKNNGLIHVMTPRISCLLPVFNGEPYLREAIDSILRQSYIDFELVAVDDGSTDDTPAILEEYSLEDSRVKIVRRPNGGIVAALNSGLSVCRGEYVARMDADDVSSPERFAMQVRYLDENAGCVVVGGSAVAVDGTGNVIARTTGGRHRRTDLSLFPPKIAVAMHPLVMIRKSALDVIGGYRDDFPHAEDYDLFIRLSDLGSIDNPDADVLMYRRHDGAISIRNLDLQERSAAAAEVRAIAEAGHPAVLNWLLEPYVRLRIFRRIQMVDPGRADAMLFQMVRDLLRLSIRSTTSSRYLRLRSIIFASLVRMARRKLLSRVRTTRLDS